VTTPLRVLVVEDNAADVDLVREALSEASPAAFHVESAPRLSSALAHLQARGCDLVLLDLGLPDSQGIETLRTLRQTVPDVPVIVLTGTDDEEIGAAAVACGAQDYLVKGEVNAHSIARSARHAVERAQAERRLRESEERFRSLYENVPIGLYRAAPDGAILLANPAFVRMLGFSSTDQFMMTDLSADGFAPSYPRSQFIEGIEENGTVTGLEATWTRRDETKLIVRENARAIRDPDGKTVFYDGTVEDITERKQAEDALRGSEDRYRSLVDNVPGIVFTIDLAGTITFVSRRVTETLGYETADVVNKSVLDFIPEEERQRATEAIQKGAAGVGIKRFVTPMIKSSGVRAWFECSFTRVRKDGAVIGAQGTAVDVTELKQAELERERMLKRQLAQNRITLSLGQLTALPSLLRALHDEVRTLLDADGFFVSRYHRDTGLITALFAVDEGREHDVSTFPPVPLAPEGRGMQSQVLRTGRPLNIPDWLEGERKMQTVHHLAPDGTFTPPPPETERDDCTKSALLVPLLFRGEPIGVLQVQSNRLGAYSDEDADLLAGLASVAAVSIQNALLVEEAEHAANALRMSLEGALLAVSHASETRDPYTAGHQRRATHLAVAIARELGRSDEECNTLRIAGTVHDIGKIGIPAEILSKPALLSPVEQELIHTHPEAGYGILADIPFPGPVADIVLQHHERLDGSGYPRGLKGDQVLREARILAVADVVEAMASHRPYRPARGINAALDEIEQNAGRLYDSEAAKACLRLFRDNGYALPA